MSYLFIIVIFNNKSALLAVNLIVVSNKLPASAGTALYWLLYYKVFHFPLDTGNKTGFLNLLILNTKK